MKRILLLTSIFIYSFGFSQISLIRHNLTPVTNGQVVAFNTAGDPNGLFDFKVKNNSTTSATNVKINCTSILNSNGTGFQLCFGNECLPDIAEGETYPVNIPYVTLAPGALSGNDGHFLYDVALSSPPYPKDYSFRFFQAGNPTGNTIDVTYRFDPNLSIDEINQLRTSGVIIKSTIIENQLVLDVLKSSTIEIYDLNGKMVKSSNLSYGIQTIDTSNLNSGTYIVNFTDAYGNSTSNKIIRK
jgi:hypothetical protein